MNTVSPGNNHDSTFSPNNLKSSVSANSLDDDDETAYPCDGIRGVTGLGDLVTQQLAHSCLVQATNPLPTSS